MSLMKYTTNITLYNSYFDLNNRISAKSILNIFQDVASIHAEDIGVGYLSMLEKNLYWVLSRIKIDILKMPEINQRVIVETWPHEKGRIDFDRDMRILSEEGEVLIIGTSKWCVIDIKSRALCRTENVQYIGEYFLEKNYEERFGKIVLPEDEMEQKFVYEVSFSDLDHNEHMNNTNYANLVLNAVKDKKFSHFEINFLSECLPKDLLSISSLKTNDGEYVIGKTKEKTSFTAFVK